MVAETETGTEEGTQEVQPFMEDLAAQFEPEQSPPAQRTEVETKEPPQFESTDDALKWMATQHSQTQAQLRALSENVAKREQDEFVASQMADLETAIKTIGEDVDIDPFFIEGALHVKYNRDPAFQKIFDNRGQNPAAYKKALGLVAAQLKEQSVVKQDGQLAENSRALDQLQKSSRSGATQEDPNSEAANMSAAEFDQYWNKLLRG